MSDENSYQEKEVRQLSMSHAEDAGDRRKSIALNIVENPLKVSVDELFKSGQTVRLITLHSENRPCKTLPMPKPSQMPMACPSMLPSLGVLLLWRVKRTDSKW